MPAGLLPLSLGQVGRPRRLLGQLGVESLLPHAIEGRFSLRGDLWNGYEASYLGVLPTLALAWHRVTRRGFLFGELGPDQESDEAPQDCTAEPSPDRAGGAACVRILRLAAYRQAEQHPAHGTQSGTDGETFVPVVRRPRTDLLTMNEEIGVPEALPGGNDRDGTGGDQLDFCDRRRWRGLTGKAPTQEGLAQKQDEPETYQAVTTARPRSET
jgi:hypothetical protein